MNEPSKPMAAWQRWAFAVVPLVAVLELVAHTIQTRSSPSEADWKAARDYVAAHARPEDSVAFAPRWADPLGREFFGPQIATVEREARPDESRFPRAFEVSIRGAHLPALMSWRSAGEARFGRVSVRAWDNPAPAHVLDDLVCSLVDPARLTVSRVEQGRETACPFTRGSPQSGGLGFGPGVPGDRFTCPGGSFVGVSVVTDLDYVPHRCVYAPPTASGVLRLQFHGVRFGRTLHGHHGIYVEAERDRKRAPVTLRLKAGDTLLGAVVHTDGDGWKPFQFDTGELEGKEGELSAEITAPSSDRRLYCFEADTR